MRYISAEYQKYNRTFTKKLIWIAPVIMLLIGMTIMPGQFFVSGCYNFWYSMMLPGALSLICAGVVQKDQKKLKYRAILSLPFDPINVWIGKIGISIFFTLITCIVLFIGITLGGVIRESPVTFTQSAAASLIILLTFLWQIPLCLLLTEYIGMFATIFINLVGNIVGIVCFAKTTYWWIPYAIPSRLMCPVIHLYPNGLFIPENDPLLSTSVILPGIFISLVLFLALTLLSALLFRKKEAK